MMAGLIKMQRFRGEQYMRMSDNSFCLIAAGALTVGIFATATAQEAADKNVDVGHFEYVARCATCHGLNGAGDGPLSRLLKKPVPNLTTLSKRNADVFPFLRVYETIDGRQEIEAHGPREMPIWGNEYRAGSYVSRGYSPESFIRAKILALTEYIYRLQAK
jgi:mono/diheme cytochrome c family protein